MSRIGLMLSGIERSLLDRLSEANAATALSTLRLAEGRKVLGPSDDPTTFVALSQLQSRLNVVTSTMANVTAASNVVTQTQTTLGQIRTQLDTIRTELEADEDQELTADQRAAAQANIDAAIAQINSLAGTTIEGRRVLDGSADFVVSGRNPDEVSDLRIYATGGATRTIYGYVQQAATQAELVYTGTDGETTSSATITLTGDLGSVALSFGNAEDLDSVATKINNQSHRTGVTASVDGDELTLTTVNYGSQVNMAVSVTDGTFAVTGGNGDGTADGTDAIAQINGATIEGTGSVDGNRLTVSDNGLRVQIDLAVGFTGYLDTMTVSGGGLSFALGTNLNQLDTLALPGLQANRLGGLSGTLDQIASGGDVSGLGENTSQAIRIVDEAIGELTRVEGQVDGFYNAAITSSSALLTELQTDLEDAITQTDGFDENEEELLREKALTLAYNATAGLAIVQQQQMSIVYLLQQVAGL